MTIKDILDEAHVLYENSVDYPGVNDEDFLVRLTLANIAIRSWAATPGVMWRELYSSVSDTLSADGDALVANLDFPAGKLKIGGAYYSYLPPDLVQEHLIYGGRQVYTLIGNGETTKIVAYPNPGAQAFELNYYKKPYVYTSGSDTTPIEMSRPGFIAHFINMRLFLDDGDNDRASVSAQSMEEQRDAMITTNNATPVYTDARQTDKEFKGFGN